MTFDEILEQVLLLLQHQGRVSYRALQRRFDIDDEYLAGLKEEIIHAQRVATDEEGRILVWAGSQMLAPVAAPSIQPTITHKELPVQSPSTASHIPDAERRQLTVMFCDLVGSTALSGELDPEDLREVIREYQNTCATVIRRFEGYIAQYLGDGLLIYFGFPTAHDDDAQRAVHAGLGILAAIKHLNAHLKQTRHLELAVRVGIHTGAVVVGAIGVEGRQEQLALGETPNIAARIQGLADPDTLAISDATYHLIEGYFACQSLGEQELKGVSHFIQVYQVMAASGAQTRLDVATSRGLTPLVGRVQETGLLFERWEQAKSGLGQVILVSGEAGIGKSRVIQGLREHIADDPHTRFEGYSSPYYTNTALYPILDILQRTLRLQGLDSAEERLAHLEAFVEPYRLSRAETVPLLAQLLAIPVPEERYLPLNWPPQRQRQKTFEALLALLLQSAEQQPVLFVLEDLHWTDPTTLEFLTLLIEQVPTAPLLLCLTTLPGFVSPWGNRSYFTQITLARLAPQLVARLATQSAGGKDLPEEVLEQIIQKTDGVPLFIEELTKSVLESGFLKDIDGHYELTGPLASFAIPTSLQDSLMARLDRLATAKRLAQIGAVMGRQFSYELLQAVAKLDESTLQQELGRLVAAELLYQRGLPPHATYLFKHALVQDTAYQSLLRSDRQHYHRQIAQLFTEHFAAMVAEQPELLAHHYTAAGLSETAVRYWHQAGEQALTRSSYTEAMGYLTQGLEVLETLPDTDKRIQDELLLRVALGDTIKAVKGFAAPEVEVEYTRAYALCQHLGNPPHSLLYRILRGLRTFYLMQGALQKAYEWGERFLSLAQQHQDTAAVRQGHNLVGIPEWH